MITTNVKGGLGNQMFQYARARAIAKDRSVVLNIHELEHPAPGDTPRSLKLDHFNLGPTTIISRPISTVRKALDKVWRRLYPDWGYFQTEDYFAEETALIRSEFTLKSPSEAFRAWERKIKDASNPVSLHIRRGDYAQNQRVLREFGLCGISYYERAIEHLETNVIGPTYFVFSDDMGWVKQNLPLGDRVIFVEDPGLSDVEEMVLMSLCDHHVIANSSFSWWGAWLDPKPDKIVIAPTPWFDTASYNPRLIPDTWIKLPKN